MYVTNELTLIAIANIKFIRLAFGTLSRERSQIILEEGGMHFIIFLFPKQGNYDRQ